MTSTLGFKLLATLGILGLLALAPPPAAASSTGIVDGEVIDCADGAQTRNADVCDAVEALVRGLVDTSLLTLYQDVHFNGKCCTTDCVYDSLANRSAALEWWYVWVEAGTLDSSGNRDPIIAGNYVFYPWVAVTTGNTC